MRTFGIRFEERDFDEGGYQNEMAAFLQVEHHELSARNALDRRSLSSSRLALRNADSQDRARARCSCSPRFVHEQGIKVVCTGEGADEVFGGYDIFREALVRQFVLRRPDSKCRALLFDRLYPQIFKTAREKKSFRQFMLHDSTDIQDPLFSHLVRWNNTARIKQFFSKNLQMELDGYSAIDELGPDRFPPTSGGGTCSPKRNIWKTRSS